jgi:hypothetical protein
MLQSTVALLVGVFVLSSTVWGQAPECTRGEPEQVFYSENAAVQSVVFKPISSHEANEEVVFKSGDRLAIHNWGCESFTLSFRLESKSLAPTSDPFSQAVQTLRRLAAGKAHAVVDLSRAADGLDSLIKSRAELKPGEPYPVDGDPDAGDFQLKFTLRSSGPLSGAGRYIEFDLTLGPL